MERTPLKILAHISANTLPVYRAYRGFRTKELLAGDFRKPEDRTWDLTKRVAYDISTDKIDGILARYAGPTALGGWVDQLCDKLWFLTITKQLVKNEDISPFHYQATLSRDIAATAIRPIAQHFDISTDARPSGKMKMLSQSGAVLVACSPIAHEYPRLVEGIFSIATGASIYSGVEMVYDYAQEAKERFSDQPVAQLAIDASLAFSNFRV